MHNLLDIQSTETQEYCYVREHIYYKEIVESGISVTVNLEELFPLDKERVWFVVQLVWSSNLRPSLPVCLHTLCTKIHFNEYFKMQSIQL